MFSTILCLSTLVLTVVILFVQARREREAFRRCFPPISDAEFLARCTAGTDPHVALTVRRIISDSSGVDYESVYPSSRLIKDLGAN